MRISDWSSDVCSSDLIAESPAPGERLVFGARQLLHYARSFRLRWSPQNAKVYAEVVRDSMPVPLEVLRDALVREIDTQRATDDYEVEIFNRDLPLFVATGTKPALVVRNQIGRASCRERVCQ